MRQFTIGGQTLRDGDPCYVIAEIGHNHGGDVETALQMIQAAAEAGADAVKFQTRDNATLYSRALLEQPYTGENSYGPTYGAHRAALELSREAFADCRDLADTLGVACFSTAFDEVSADALVAARVPAIKLASGSLRDFSLLTHVGSLGTPVILSTGGGTLGDIHKAVNTLVVAGCSNLAILHCTAAYPVRDWSELNLRCITTLREEYPEFVIGWSGHDSGIAMAVAAYTLGAGIIEKHFTLNRASKGTDHAFSLEPAGLTKLVRDLHRTYQALGDGMKRYYPSELGPISKMRRRQTPEGLRITGEQDVLA